MISFNFVFLLRKYVGIFSSLMRVLKSFFFLSSSNFHKSCSLYHKFLNLSSINFSTFFSSSPAFSSYFWNDWSIEKKLEELGLYRGKAPNPMRLGLCSRSKDVIEPMLKPQWWVNCADMAKDACDAVRDGRMEIIPKEQEATWFRWLENIRDWCISRQLWWGHRIPAFYVNFDDDQENMHKINPTHQAY